MKKKAPETNFLSDDIYSKSKLFAIKVIIFIVILFSLGFIATFPLESMLDKKIYTALSQNPSCPMTYKKLNLSFFFFPKLQLDGFRIPPQCLGKGNEGVTFDSVALKLIRPSFIPFGTKVKVEINQKLKGKKINFIVDVTLGFFKESLVAIDNQTITGDFINQFIGPKFLVGGPLQIDTLVGLKDFRPISGHLKIKSNNFFLPSQSMSGFTLPKIDLKNFNAKASIKGQTLKVETFSMGTDESPLQFQISGPITLNQSQTGQSRLNLTGQLRLSQDFLTNFSFITLLLGNTQGDEGRFPISVGGTLSSPQLQQQQ